MRKPFTIQKTTCFAVGIVAAAVGVLGGALMMAGFGEVQYAHTAVFVLMGGMLLLLALQYKGSEYRARRLKYLLLFFLWMIALLRLPLLDWVEVAVLPLMVLMERQKGDGPWVLLLLLAEVGYAAVRTVALIEPWGAATLSVVGGAFIAVSLVRGLLIVLLLYRAKKEKKQPREEGVHRLRKY